MKKIILAALGMVVCMVAGCKEESAGRPSALNNAAKAPHPTSDKSLLSEGKKDTTHLTGYDARNILASKPLERTQAMHDRDCAILYHTGIVHDLRFKEDGQSFDKDAATNSYELLLEECPDSPHAEEARLALKDLGAQIRK